MGKNHRAERLGEEIRKIVSNMLLRGDLKDPAFGSRMIGISDVSVTGDGSYATVYITILSYAPGASVTDHDRSEVIGAFERCRGYIRSVIGRQVKVRYIPELIFKIDESFEYGARMDRILDSLDIRPADEPDKTDEDFDEFAEELDDEI